MGIDLLCKWFQIFSNNFWKIGNNYIYVQIFSRVDFKVNDIFLAGSKWSLHNLFCGDSNNLLSVDLVPLSAEIYFVYYSCSIVQLSGFWFRIHQLVYNNIMNIWIEFHLIYYWVLYCCLIVSLVVGCFIVVFHVLFDLYGMLFCFSCFGEIANRLLSHYSLDF